MNDYILTTSLITIGIAYHSLSVVKEQRKKYPEFSFKSIWANFLKEEWDSLIASALGLIVFEFALYIIRLNSVEIPFWIENWGMYVIAILWGYAGQRVAYKYLQTGESVLESKAERLRNIDT